MKTITFRCETITPMFLAGADGKTPELRPPSIKGALRFWWRAMNAGKYDTIPKLKEAESKIFGGTDEKAGRSKVILRLLSKQPKEDNFIKEAPLPHKKKRDKGYFEKKAIKTGFKFDLEIGLQENPIISIEQIRNLFIVFSILGGIGNRSRRGFGSFKILEIDGKTFKTEVSQQFVENEINKIGTINPQATQDYPFIRDIEVGKKPINLQNIGNVTHNIKQKYGGYNNNFKYENSIGNSNPRFSSPIYVSVIQNNGELFPVVITLNTVAPNNRTHDESVQTEFKNAILQR